MSELLHSFIEEQVPFNKHLGMRLVRLEHGQASLELPFRQELVGDPWRPALHGGVIATLIDVCAGAAVFSLFDQPGDRASTVDLRVDYLRPGRLEALVAEAAVLRAGKRVAVVDVLVYHPGRRDDLIATGKGVYDLRRVRRP